MIAASYGRSADTEVGRWTLGQPELLGQSDALQLPRGSLGNLVEEDQSARNLEVGQLPTRELADLSLARL